MLAALGRFCHRRSRWILVAWLIVLVVGFGLGSRVFDRLADTAYAPPGSESVRGDDLLTDVAGQGDQIVVLLDGHRVDDPALRTAVEDAVGDVRTQPHVLQAVDWYGTHASTLRATDGRATLVLVEVDGALAKADRDRAYDDVASRMRELSHAVPGMTVRIGGPTAVGRDINGQLEHDLRVGELIALPVTLVLMILVFGGLVPALLPIASAVAAIATSLLALLGFSYAIDVDSNAISITTILGLGLSIDYALLIVNRYREERGRGLPGPAAVSRTVAVAGRTVCFSALTVATALSGLFAFRTPMFHTFAIAGVAVVVLAALAALTLVPALLAVAGRFVKVPTAPLPDDGFFARLARWTRRFAPFVAVGVVAVLLLAGAPFLRAEFGGVGADILPASAQSRQVADIQRDRFPGGDAEPVRVVASVPVARLAAYGDATVRSLPDVAHVRALAEGNGVSTLEVYADRATDGRSSDEVDQDLVEALRAHRPDFPTYVTGSGALLVDMKAEIRDRLPWGIGLIALTTFVLLFLMTGSVLVPVKALVMDTLSLSTTFGMLVLVFQEGHLSGLLGFDPPGSLDLFVPIIVFAFAFGLSMDYEVFLLSRIKETYDATRDNDRAVELGLQRSGRIITSAALIVVVVCIGFTFGKLVFIKEMGLAMCVAVAVDATLVRCLLVPATMSLLGRANWWAPRWLRAVHEWLGLHEHATEHGWYAYEPIDVPASRDGDEPTAPLARIGGGQPLVDHFRQTVPTSGGRSVPIRVFAAAGDAPVLVFWPALGVPAGYYDRFGSALADRGCSVVLADLPGQGDSTVDPRTASLGYADVLAGDYADTAAAARERFPAGPLLVGGNSIGGQLAVLYAAQHPDDVHGVVLVATGTVYFGSFGGLRGKLSVLGLSQFVGATARFTGHWPGDRFNFGGAQPGALMRDWARNGRTGRYVVGGVDLEPRIAAIRAPVLAVSMDGDGLAPVRSVDHLCRKFRSARVDRWHHAPDGERPGHLKWARRPAAVADRVTSWLGAVQLTRHR